MACNTCETSFKAATSVVVSIVKSGTTALLYVQNQGRNIVHLRRILLCTTSGSTFYLRPPPSGISWSGPEYLEPGMMSLYYSFTPPAGSAVQAQAEYIEIDGRSRSCAEQF
ncbi:MAG TPA: hypothetical protein VF006_26795 [Longimicrobium sp.]